jgi:hypothetical protein
MGSGVRVVRGRYVFDGVRAREDVEGRRTRGDVREKKAHSSESRPPTL